MKERLPPHKNQASKRSSGRGHGRENSLDSHGSLHEMELLQIMHQGNWDDDGDDGSNNEESRKIQCAKKEPEETSRLLPANTDQQDESSSNHSIQNQHTLFELPPSLNSNNSDSKSILGSPQASLSASRRSFMMRKNQNQPPQIMKKSSSNKNEMSMQGLMDKYAQIRQQSSQQDRGVSKNNNNNNSQLAGSKGKSNSFTNLVGMRRPASRSSFHHTTNPRSGVRRASSIRHLGASNSRLRKSSSNNSESENDGKLDAEQKAGTQSRADNQQEELQRRKANRRRSSRSSDATTNSTATSNSNNSSSQPTQEYELTLHKTPSMRELTKTPSQRDLVNISSTSAFANRQSTRFSTQSAIVARKFLLSDDDETDSDDDSGSKEFGAPHQHSQDVFQDEYSSSFPSNNRKTSNYFGKKNNNSQQQQRYHHSDSFVSSSGVSSNSSLEYSPSIVRHTAERTTLNVTGKGSKKTWTLADHHQAQYHSQLQVLQQQQQQFKKQQQHGTRSSQQNGQAFPPPRQDLLQHEVDQTVNLQDLTNRRYSSATIDNGDDDSDPEDPEQSLRWNDVRGFDDQSTDALPHLLPLNKMSGSQESAGSVRLNNSGVMQQLNTSFQDVFLGGASKTDLSQSSHKRAQQQEKQNFLSTFQRRSWLWHLFRRQQTSYKRKQQRYHTGPLNTAHHPDSSNNFTRIVASSCFRWTLVLLISLVVAVLGGLWFWKATSSADALPTAPPITSGEQVPMSPEQAADFDKQQEQELKDLLEQFKSILTEKKISSPDDLAWEYSDSNNPLTPHDFALQWMAKDILKQPSVLVAHENGNEDISFGNNIEGNIEVLVQAYALAVLYFSTTAQPDKAGSSSWTVNKNWVTPSPLCEWYAIDCEDGRRDPRGTVVSLNLTNNNLHGSLNESFLQEIFHGLPHLRTLDLSRNHLTGPLPELSIDERNQIRGTVDVTDTDFALCPSLEFVWLQGNELSGSLPSSWVNGIPNMRSFRVSQNKLSGNVPDIIDKWSQLSMLGLHNNLLGGKFPYVEGMEHLEYLWIHDNRFEDHLPYEFFRLKALKEIKAQRNAFSGTIPPEIENLKSLRILQLNDNRIEGRLPNVFNRNHDLVEIHLQKNQLSGPIPQSFAELSMLEILLLDSNKLSGLFPSELSKLTNLVEFRALDTSLSGSIPAEFCRLKEDHVLAFVAVDCDLVTDCTCCDECR